MTKFKRIISMFLLASSLTLTIFANEPQVLTYNYPEYNTTIVFSDDTKLESDKRKVIADSIAYNSTISQTYSLCWLTGHNLSTETVTETNHKVATYEPRCLIKIYSVTTCSKCDHIETVLKNSDYIWCCPEE